MTPAEIAIINSTIAFQLSCTGKGLMPETSSNTESLAWDYMIGAKVETYGKGLKEAAKKRAIAAGVMFDHEKEPRDPYTEEVVYDGKIVSIHLKVKTPALTFDHKSFIAKVLARNLVSGVNIDDFNLLYTDSFKKSRAAHAFTAELVEG